MPDNRVLYAAQAVLVGPSPATGAQASGNIKQLHRVQSTSYDWQRQLQDVQQFGFFAPIDRVETQLPQVSLNVSYLSTNVANESGIGLYVGGDSTALKNILDGTERDKNYFIKVAPDGNAASYTGTSSVIAFGNGVISNYSAQGQVGSFPTASFTISALDWVSDDTTVNFDHPAVDPQNGQAVTGYVTLPPVTTGIVGQATALRHGDVTVDLDGAGLGINNLFIQSYNFTFDFNLEETQAFGYKFAAAREPQFPINCQMSIDANVRDIGTGRLSNLSCNDQKYDLSVTVREPRCDGTTGSVKCVYSLKGATLESQNFSDSIGPSKTVTLNFSVPIGGPQETDRGFFLSGALN